MDTLKKGLTEVLRSDTQCRYSLEAPRKGTQYMDTLKKGLTEVLRSDNVGTH